MKSQVMDIYAKVITEQARKARGETLTESVGDHQVPAAAMKHDAEHGEDVSKGSDHHIRYTPAATGQDHYYHGHAGGKKFSVKVTGGYDETQNKGKYSYKKHIQQMHNDVASGLKASGIGGDMHKKIAAKIRSHNQSNIDSLED